MKQEVQDVLDSLAAMGREQTKKTYLRHGAKEPLFGVTTGAMKPLSKQYKNNQELALALYEIGNYDAMYFAGMIVNPKIMSREIIESWMEQAYFQGLSDYVVSVTLAETPFAEEVADTWILHKEELYQSAGWNTYAGLLGTVKDEHFDIGKLTSMLHTVKKSIHEKPNWVRYAMNGFVIAVGISYLPLHEEALHIAKQIGRVHVDMGKTSCNVPDAYAQIVKAKDKKRIGFKRKNVRC